MKQAQYEATWRHYARASASHRIGKLSGLTRVAAEERLRRGGFVPESPASAGSVTWRHSDGSSVRVDPPHDGRRNFPSDRRTHYHKYVRIETPNHPGARQPYPLSDRGRVVVGRSTSAHILSGQRQREAAFEAELEVALEAVGFV